jgi:hypothetical protein
LKKVLVVFSIAVIISLIALIVFMEKFPAGRLADEKELLEYSFPNEKKIFLIGSSHIGQLNVTVINQKTNLEKLEHEVYNLGISGDTPSKRVRLLDHLINQNPELVIYGVSYRDFSSLEKQPFVDIKKELHELYSKIDPNNEYINPKLVSLDFLKKTISGKNSFNSEMNTPSYQFLPIFTKIKNIDELETDATRLNESINVISLNENQEYFDFVKIISKLKKNNIEVIILVNPLHETLLKKIKIENKNNFDEIIKKIQNEHNVKVIDLSNKYSKEEFFVNADHISLNNKSNLVNKDIGNIIIQEINK